MNKQKSKKNQNTNNNKSNETSEPIKYKLNWEKTGIGTQEKDEDVRATIDERFTEKS